MHYFSKFLKSKSLLIWIRRILENSEVVKKCFVKTFLENDWIFLFSQVWWVLHSRPPSRIFGFILEIYWKIETIIWVVGFLFKMMILLLFHCSKTMPKIKHFLKIVPQCVISDQLVAFEEQQQQPSDQHCQATVQVLSALCTFQRTCQL